MMHWSRLWHLLLALMLLSSIRASNKVDQGTSIQTKATTETPHLLDQAATKDALSLTRHLRGSTRIKQNVSQKRKLKGSKTSNRNEGSMNYHPRDYPRPKRKPHQTSRGSGSYARRPRTKRYKRQPSIGLNNNVFATPPPWYNPRHRGRVTPNNYNQGKNAANGYPMTIWPRIPSDSVPVTPTQPITSPTLPPATTSTPPSPPPILLPPPTSVQPPTQSPTLLLVLPAAAVLVPQCNTQGGASIGSLWGPIPHVRTLDGLAFDVPGGVAGDLVLAQGGGGGGGNNGHAQFRVQARVEPVTSNLATSTTTTTSSSIATAVALQLNNQLAVEISLARRALSSQTGMWGTSCAVNAWHGNNRIDLSADPPHATLSSSNNVEFFTTAGTLEIFVASLGLSITVQPIESGTMGCYLNVFLCLDDRAVMTNASIKGLLGTPNDNIQDDWQTGEGQVLSLPTITDDATGDRQAYDYATTHWCQQYHTSLFVHSELSRNNVAESSSCTNRPFGGSINPDQASSLVQEICSSDNDDMLSTELYRACLASGVVGQREEAQYARWVISQLESVLDRAPARTPSPTGMPATNAPTTSTPTTTMPRTNFPTMQETPIPSTSVPMVTDTPTIAPTTAATLPPTNTTTVFTNAPSMDPTTPTATLSPTNTTTTVNTLTPFTLVPSSFSSNTESPTIQSSNETAVNATWIPSSSTTTTPTVSLETASPTIEPSPNTTLTTSAMGSAENITLAPVGT